MTSPRVLTATFAALLIGRPPWRVAPPRSPPPQSRQGPGAQVTVNATDTACELSATEGAAGPATFVVTNNGTAATEFYVYGKDNRVLGEVENISPGLQRQLVVQFDEPGSYTVACKPGMVGDGIRGDSLRHGRGIQDPGHRCSTKASEDYKTYVLGQAGELVTATVAFVASVKASDIAAAKAQYPTSRTSWERIEPVAESFLDDLDPRIDLREAGPAGRPEADRLPPAGEGSVGERPAADTNAVADQLLADINELQEKIAAPGFPRERHPDRRGAQGLLDEIAVSKITGEEDIFSHTDLWDFHANIEGSPGGAGRGAPHPRRAQRRTRHASRPAIRRGQPAAGQVPRRRRFRGLHHCHRAAAPGALAAIDALSKEVSQVQGVIAVQ